MPERIERLTKRQKRVLKQQGVLDTNNNLSSGFNVKENVQPKTDTQELAFDAWEDGHNLMLHGIAGTGKTFLALYFSISEILSKNAHYKKVCVIRSVVPSRDMGYLPGTQKDKMKVYEGPYYDICTKLFKRGDAYEVLKQRNSIEFMSTSFLRGSTFDDCILVVDEVQNMSDQELHTVMTRVGENCRIIFCGDVGQDDLTSERKKEVSGLRNFMKIISKMKEFKFVEFTVNDIVRSDLVKSYIIQRNALGI
jgi:predicted ribonuclease YlaK